MKSNSKTTILFVLLVIAFSLSTLAVQAESCVCLDFSGKAYTKDFPPDSACYTCSADACEINGKTLKDCPVKTETPKSEAKDSQTAALPTVVDSVPQKAVSDTQNPELTAEGNMPDYGFSGPALVESEAAPTEEPIEEDSNETPAESEEKTPAENSPLLEEGSETVPEAKIQGKEESSSEETTEKIEKTEEAPLPEEATEDPESENAEEPEGNEGNEGNEKIEEGNEAPEDSLLPEDIPTEEEPLSEEMIPTETAKLLGEDPPSTAPAPAPEAPVLECPKGFYTTRSLGFYFAPSAYADEYEISWSNTKGDSGKETIQNNDSTCQNNRCIKQISLPKDGKYTWYVTAKNASGKEAKSKAMSFTVGQNLAAPKAYQPNGVVYNRNCLSFQWQDVGSGAESYRIQIVGKWDGKVRLDTSFDVKDLYIGDGVCWVSTSLFPPAGTYSWRVKARNSKTESDWSGWKDFVVHCDYCTVGGAYYGNYANTIPSPIYPISTISTTSPEFQWRTLTGAAVYTIKIFDESGNLLAEESPDNSHCTLEACTYDPQLELPGNGKYTWTIDGYGPNGGRWGSSNGTFEIVGVQPVPEMQFLLPLNGGFLSEAAPIIFWQDPGETVSNFQLEVLDDQSTSLLVTNLTREDAWCDGTTCSIEFESIPDGSDYVIRITPLTDYLTPGKTISLTFSKGIPPMVLTAPKNNAVVQARPLFRWNLDAGNEAEYELTLTNSSAENIVFSPLRCGEDGLTCEGTEALFVPAETLSADTYSATISVHGSDTPSETTIFEVK